MFKLENFQIFFIIFNIYTIIVSGQMDSNDLDLKFENQDNSDITKDFTDNELKLALNDLSLKDLNNLQSFIDSVDYKDLDYQEGSLIKPQAKVSAYNDYDVQFDDANYPDDASYICESQNYDNSDINLETPQEETQRGKRSDRNINANAEYIKQLDYSFPQNVISNNNDKDSEFKTEHIRVKRH